MATMFTGNQIIADIAFDAVTSEAHSMEATATPYAVDGNAMVSDHVTVLPDSLEIRGCISNSDGGSASEPSSRSYGASSAPASVWTC